MELRRLQTGDSAIADSQVEFGERWMVTEESVLARERPAPTFDNHEDVIRHIVLGHQSKLRRRYKPKSWVILRVAEHRHSGSTQLPAFVEARMHESRANALPLSAGRNRHRRETHKF